MISILPSEGLAPSSSGTKQNKLSDTSPKSDEPSFSSLVSRDPANDAADSRSDQPTPEQATAPLPDRSTPDALPKVGDTLRTSELIDPALADVEKSSTQPSDGETVRAPTQSDMIADATAQTDTPAIKSPNVPSSEALSVSDADSAALAKRTQAPIAPGTASAEQAQTASETLDANAADKLPADADPLTTSKVAATDKLVAAELAPEAQPKASRTAEASDDALQIIRTHDHSDSAKPEHRAALLNTPSVDQSAATAKAIMATMGTDASAAATVTTLPESVMPMGQAQATSAAAITSGLTPVVPSVPIAAPSELNSIILNALKNGGEPQEQLIVQLDPPELGRVAIDFKFDAQGVQQITVTADNPEALRRLRELHFELTEALKDHGLSEQNLSFRQQADDQSGSGWQMAESGRPESLFSSSEQEPEHSPILRSNANHVQLDRLDLTL